MSKTERLERIRNCLIILPLALGFYYILGALLVATMSGSKSVSLTLLAASPGLLAMAFSFAVMLIPASIITAWRYRVPLRYRRLFEGEEVNKTLSLLAASPRAVVVTLEIMRQDREAHFASRDSGIYRRSVDNALIWNFFADEPDSPVSRMMVESLSLLDEVSVPWPEIQRLIEFGFRYLSELRGRSIEEAQSVGEMTAAFMDSTLTVHDAVSLVHSRGADVAKLMFSGVPLEYAIELAQPVGSEAW